MRVPAEAGSSANPDCRPVEETSSSQKAVSRFGRELREAHFHFAPSYTPLNHGSFGSFPSSVRGHQRRLQDAIESRPDTFIRFTYPKLLRQTRAAVSPLLGAAVDEVVLLPNVTTAINVILRNLCYQDGDVILYFNTIYPSCLKTIQSLQETTPVTSHCIELTYPVEDCAIIDKFRAAIDQFSQPGSKRVKIALFDTVLTFPGVRFPWESLVRICREKGMLSCIDGAHGIGHIDLTHLAHEGPDFFVSNCYKWLFVPRGCAVMYVPYRNQALIRTTFPTAEGYLPESQRRRLSTREYFVQLFNKIATTDTTPYLCIIEALKFRNEVCGGESQVREYCTRLARDGGDRMATMLGTSVLENATRTLGNCCFTNVCLPLEVERRTVPPREPLQVENLGMVPVEEANAVADWITRKSVEEFDTFIATRYYAGAFWVRISAQIYLQWEDFEWAATVLLELCGRVKAGCWREDGDTQGPEMRP